MNVDTPAAAPLPEDVLFARGVISRLAIWPTLRVAVQEGWGGPSSTAKRTWLASEVVDAFTSPESASSGTPDEQWIEEMLLQVMADEYEVRVEDGSAEGVSRDIIKLWEASRTGDALGLVEGFEKKAESMSKTRTQTVTVVDAEEVEGDGDEDDEDWEDEDGSDAAEEVPQLVERRRREKEEPEVDEDGFTMVKKKGRS